MNHTYLLRLARESFKAIQAFRKNNDIEGLRQFVHPSTLNEWAIHDSFQNALTSADVTILTSGEQAFTVRFRGKTSDECWTFEFLNGRWLVRAIAQADSQTLIYSKAS
jgi:hypothetical protein